MGYSKAPWTFKGRALYQLQLVKAEEARKYIPPELKMVELFGFTLGGVYLARYEDSPAGAFDECVVMAGLVWNPPTSCAWAARVYVDSREARDHGVASVGLPSRLAAFSDLSQRGGGSSGGAWWQRRRRQEQPQQPQRLQQRQQAGGGGSEVVELANVQPGARGLPGRPVALLQLPRLAAYEGGSSGFLEPLSGFLGPRMRLSLPSFSGGTREHPGLLQYSCDLRASVMPVAPMRIILPASATSSSSSSKAEGELRSTQQDGQRRWGSRQQQQHRQHRQQQQQQQQQHPEVLDLLLTGKPLVCLAFSDMEMRVEEPTRLHLAAPQQQQQQQQQQQGPRHPMPAFAAVLPTGAAAAGGR